MHYDFRSKITQISDLLEDILDDDDDELPEEIIEHLEAAHAHLQEVLELTGSYM